MTPNDGHLTNIQFLLNLFSFYLGEKKRFKDPPASDSTNMPSTRERSALQPGARSSILPPTGWQTLKYSNPHLLPSRLALAENWIRSGEVGAQVSRCTMGWMQGSHTVTWPLSQVPVLFSAFVASAQVYLLAYAPSSGISIEQPCSPHSHTEAVSHHHGWEVISLNQASQGSLGAREAELLEMATFPGRVWQFHSQSCLVPVLPVSQLVMAQAQPWLSGDIQGVNQWMEDIFLQLSHA